MLYEIKIRLNEEELKKFHFQGDTFVKPLYKKEPDDQERNWILSHSEMIKKGIIASYVYDLYQKDFINKRIVTKMKFYKECRKILNLEMKKMSIENETKYCFL